MRYELLLCDADDTLFDFHLGEKQALVDTFLSFGLKADEETTTLYHQINDALWKALERGETTQEKLKTERFRQLIAIKKLALTPEEMADAYVENLSRQAHLMPGAEAFCKTVSQRMPIYLVTNGISKIQRARFAKSAIAPYIADIIISQEVGTRKPDPKMLEIALEKAGIQKEKAVMLGDSITADIPAAKSAGVDSILICWGKKQAHAATYCVDDLSEAQAIILS